MDRKMSMNEIDEDILFAGDESDTLFIAAVQHDPVTADIIKKFPHMLGDEGEEFIASFPSVGEEAIDMDSLVFIEKETFDLDQAISNATMEEADPLSPFIMDDIAFESSDHTIDLDQIFDVMQITTVTTPPDNFPPFVRLSFP
jgi:hypothetical protein